MVFGQDITQYAIVFMISIAVGGLALAILYPMFVGTTASTRIQSVTSNTKTPSKQSFRARMMEDSKDTRRKQIQENLKQVSDREKQRKKRLTLRTLISQSGLDITPRLFWVYSAVVGVVFGLVPLFFNMAWYVSLGSLVVGFLGFPRWVLKYIRTRRQNTFLHDFADAIDIMVRGLKSGLPVNDAMKIIATESGPPVGPEFAEIVEGQKIGISIDQGVERMVERMPLPEVNFLSIVMNIQTKTGGNLSEALGNLSKVLRDRKKMKAKIRSVSQEAKSSAMIIGALPFIIMGGLMFLNPSYMDPLLNTQMGHIVLMVSGGWMLTGVLVMRKMINIDL
jgi:tight adherence protein B